MGLNNYGPAVSGLGSSSPSSSAGPGAGSTDSKAAEKTAFDIKLEKFDAATKIKIIKEVRSFTDLGLKEAKDLVEKAPVVVKKGVAKEEANSIMEKLKELGATVMRSTPLINAFVAASAKACANSASASAASATLAASSASAMAASASATACSAAAAASCAVMLLIFSSSESIWVLVRILMSLFSTFGEFFCFSSRSNRESLLASKDVEVDAILY
ncbi:hypothetical protein F0562_006270 [Nyssa sinensis]|uniref:Large ribosomal subunit protein bL12c n=1 Tax=Nyssa sinensis TaxID=561372 RepID=A0A5J5ARB0_9ASTE|nr:hypothetical protein F0562_006270 [Nyssa sinensis]